MGSELAGASGDEQVAAGLRDDATERERVAVDLGAAERLADRLNIGAYTSTLRLSVMGVPLTVSVSPTCRSIAQYSSRRGLAQLAVGTWVTFGAAFGAVAELHEPATRLAVVRHAADRGSELAGPSVTSR